MEIKIGRPHSPGNKFRIIQNVDKSERKSQLDILNSAKILHTKNCPLFLNCRIFASCSETKP